MKAARIFQKERNFNDAARNFESARDFERAVDCLLKVNRYSEVLDLVSRYEDLIQRGEENTILKHPRYDQRDENICYQAAKFYKRRGDDRLMSDALERLPKVEDRITFLKRNEFFDQAADLLLREERAEEAARLMRSKGKFLEAARYSDDHSFIADCYLLAARSTVRSMKVRNKEYEEMIEGLFERATEMYKRCENINGQAEVLFARGKFCRDSEDVNKAANLYNQVRNYAALTDCCLLPIDHDSRKVSCPQARDTLKGLLHLILSLYKENKENSERTAISMCYAYFGLEDTDDVCTKKVPHLEMVRFTNLQNDTTKSDGDELIPVTEGDRLIKEQLHKMAHKLIEQMWEEAQKVINRSKPCPQFIAGIPCDITTCNHHHEQISRVHFTNRFQALLFLVHAEDTIANFLKYMKRESAKVKNQLQKQLFIKPEFTACHWLYQLLFPQDGELVSSYFLSEGDVSFLRRQVSDRIIEFATKSLWDSSSEEERRSSSDLFIKVSNLVHIAGAPNFPIGKLYTLLAVEEKKFQSRNVRDHPGIFFDRSSGRYDIFSKSLERSKSRLYWNGDVLGSVHAAVKKFLFASAKRKALPYPSIANVVMILERHLTACLLLYTRFMMNETIVCLPESYLSMVNFWDFVDRPRTNRSITLYTAIQASSQLVQGRDNLNRLFELTWYIVALTFGEIRWEYNIVSDALCANSINCVEAERVLVLALTMLCNCGRGIPDQCEQLIREHLLTLRLRQDLSKQLKKCVEDVRSATGIQDIIRCLEELLAQKHRQERLCDVKWDDYKAKDLRMNCKFYRYSKQFRFEIDVNAISERKRREETETTEEEINDNYPQVFDEQETHSQRQEYDEEHRKKAALAIERAFLDWKHRKEIKAKSEEMIKNDPVKRHFQPFKLDKSGCTICSSVQFVDHGSDITDTVSADASSLLDQSEEVKSTWRILKRNTFETHCSKGSPHWKKEIDFREFRKFYEKLIQPTIDGATQLMKEMTKLTEETEVDCSLDLDRLNNSLSRLNSNIKKVEDSRTWDSVYLIRHAAHEVKNVTSKIIKDRNAKKGKRRYSSVLF